MTLTETQRITAKDIADLLKLDSLRTAERYLTDIKKEYQVPCVLGYHFKLYFKIP